MASNQQLLAGPSSFGSISEVNLEWVLDCAL